MTKEKQEYPTAEEYPRQALGQQVEGRHLIHRCPHDFASYLPEVE
jgi:hypothetical protein